MRTGQNAGTHPGVNNPSPQQVFTTESGDISPHSRPPSVHSYSSQHIYNPPPTPRTRNGNMIRSPAKHPANLPDDTDFVPPRYDRAGSRPSSPAKLSQQFQQQQQQQQYYPARSPPGSPRNPAGSLQPNGNNGTPSPSQSPSPGYLAPNSNSRPGTPSGSRANAGSARSDDSHTLLSPSAMSIGGGLPPSSSTSHSASPNTCSACNQPMTAQFVRALGTVFHLDCFRCRVSFLSIAARGLLIPPLGL